MTYQETLDFLYNSLPAYHRIGKAAYKNNLNNTTQLDDHLANPHKKFMSVHVAGTNGKGSVSHMISSVLQEAGYKTGLYTSPHLTDFRERIKINGVMISREEVISFVDENREFIDSLKPSFFEITVAMAFSFFAKSNVDIAVIEVGLGGRLDSTNIINPILSVITNIGHDHMDLLGDTIEKIATEKAGIIKQSVPVVISETQDETQEVFVSRAAATESDIQFADKNFSCLLQDTDDYTSLVASRLSPLSGRISGQRNYLIKSSATGTTYEGTTALGGDYQIKNIAAVYQVFDSLKNSLQFTNENVINGIARVVVNTGLQGRWQILNTNPLTICDTGHNKEGLEFVLNQIKGIAKTGLHMIVGFVNDKDLSIVLPLFPKDAQYYFTKASVPRALDEKILKEQAHEYGLRGKIYPDVRSAMKAARFNASVSDVIFIGGSTFIVADAL
jgi:dihydrofolate synthase/folylpolyglutamate synthase